MHLYEKTLLSENVYNARIFKVYKDAVLLENGVKAERDVVKHSGGVCVVALTDKNEVLFVKQFRYPHQKVLLEIPAGKLNEGESHYDCGLRELKEETGYSAERYEYIGNLFPTPAYCSEVIHIYLATGLKNGSQKLDDDEFLDVLKIPMDKAIEMIMNGDIEDAKTQIGIMKAKLKLGI